MLEKGSQHAVADALSRAPVTLPSTDDLLGEEVYAVRKMNLCLDATDAEYDGAYFREIQAAADADTEDVQLVDTIRNGFPQSFRALSTNLRPYWNGRQQLSIDSSVALKGHRIIVPQAMRQSVLQDLHKAHQGMTRTKNRARQVVYWPGLTKDIEEMIRNCTSCREHLPSQTNEPLLNDRHPTLPFQCTSADLFSVQGWEFLVYVDRLTGWPCIDRTGRTTSSRDVIGSLRRWFSEVGVPLKLYTDGGPQFSSHRFAQFCKRWRVEHVKSSPHYPQSNGLAEAAVKSMKTLIKKTTQNGNLDMDEFRQGLLEWRNTPDLNGHSPAQKLYGHPLQSFVLAHHRSFAPEWQTKADTVDRREQDRLRSQTEYFNRSKQPLEKLKIGVMVDVQDPRTKRWSQRGTIVAVGKHRDYYVKLPSGRVYWRNRVFLRPYLPPQSVGVDPQRLHQRQDQVFPTEYRGQIHASEDTEESNCRTKEDTMEKPTVVTNHHPPPDLRRSRRQRQPVQRFDITTTAGKSYLTFRLIRLDDRILQTVVGYIQR